MVRKQLFPILYLFVSINALLLVAYINQYEAFNLKLKFVITVNTMLFAMSIFNFLRARKMDTTNPHAIVRSVMVGSLLKMLFFAGAALGYASQKKAPVGIPTLLVSMVLYLIYTWLEIRWTQIKKG